MPGSILIARGGVAEVATARQQPSAVQRWLRERCCARLQALRSGAVTLRDAEGERTVGAPDGPLGTFVVDVYDPSFWSAVAQSGDIAVGETFVAGKWSCSDLVGLLRLFVRDREVLLDLDGSLWAWPRRLLLRAWQGLRSDSRPGSERNIVDHYDLGDDLFAHFLDPSMTYSSAWFEHDGQSLADAQRSKLDRLCRLVDLQRGDRLLEIGTGWGSLALHAAGQCGARVTTTTISRNQFTRASERVRAVGLHERVQLLQSDYRDLDGTFDKLLSCEMVEAVGARFLPTYLKACAARLRPGGLLGLQAITIADRHYASALRAVDYIKRHVFPGSFIPSVRVLVETASEHTDLQLEHYEDFGLHYATTLQLWREQVLREPQPFLQRGGVGLVRAWEYYFAYCEAGFRERHIGVGHFRFRRAGG